MDVSLVFAFIFVLIVVAFLLTGGLNMVMRFFGAGEQVQLDNQAKKFMSEIFDNKTKSGIFWTTTGSSDIFNFFVGDNIEKVCFFNPADPADNPSRGWVDENSIGQFIKENNYALVYFKRGGGINGFVVERLKPQENFCITSTTNILLTNKGSSVDAEPR